MKKNMRDRLKRSHKLARAFARKGAHARAAALTPERRTEIATLAGLARQAKRRASQDAAAAVDAQKDESPDCA